MRWLVFDEETSAVLEGRRIEPELHSGSALSIAVSSGERSVVLLPGSGGQALILTAIPRQHRAVSATGFLGLVDTTGEE